MTFNLKNDGEENKQRLEYMDEDKGGKEENKRLFNKVITELDACRFCWSSCTRGEKENALFPK